MTNYEKALEIYEGSVPTWVDRYEYAIYEACENGTLDHDAWLKCLPCEAITPFEKNTCLVCGTSKEAV